MSLLYQRGFIHAWAERPRSDQAKGPSLSEGILYNSNNGRVAQLGERLVRNEEVAGSIPVTSTTFLMGSFLTGCGNRL